MGRAGYQQATRLRADLDQLERRSDSLKKVSGVLREKSKFLLEPVDFYQQKLRAVQARQRVLYSRMQSALCSAEELMNCRKSFMEGEEEIARLLVQGRDFQSSD